MIKNKKMLLAGGCLLLLGAVALAFFFFYGRREERGEDFSRESLSENAREMGNGPVSMEGAVTTVAEGLDEPMGLYIRSGVLYIAETGANRIRKVEDGTVFPVAGSGEEGLEDGPAEDASFSGPQGVCLGEGGCSC